MRQLVRDQRHQRLVADDHGRGGEGQARVLHAAVGEARRQHQQVVAAPAVRAVHRFGGVDHLAGVGEFGHRLVDHRRLRPYAAAVADRLEHQVAGGDGEQVGRDLLRHLEAVVAVARRRRIVVRAHQHHRVLRCGDVRAVGEADDRRVLQRHPRTRVDLLRLAEHERGLLALGHRRFQPLQAGGFGRGRVGDAHLGRMLGRFDGQLAAEDRILAGQFELQFVPLAFGIEALGLLDAEVAGVQQQLAGVLVQPFQAVGRGAAQRLVGEVHRQVQREVGGADLVRLGIRMLVGDLLGLRCRLRGRGGGGRGRARAALATGGDEADGGGDGGGQQQLAHGGSTCLRKTSSLPPPRQSRRTTHPCRSSRWPSPAGLAALRRTGGSRHR